MALARNLGKRPTGPKKLKLPKIKFNKRFFTIGVVVLAVLAGIYGWWNLTRATRNDKKMSIKYDTGDKPLPQQVNLWVSADGGLFMRASADAKSKIVIIIPNGTQLTAIKTEGDWYQVSYMNKTGWVNKSYVTTQAPAQDPTKDWKTYQNSANSYSVRYPTDWVVQDYGSNPASNSASYVAFGTQLPASLDPNNLPPVIVRIVNSGADAVATPYKSASGSTATATTISGLPGTVYTYTASSGVQMTAYVVAKGAQTYVIEETGGYADQLQKMVSSLNLG